MPAKPRDPVPLPFADPRVVCAPGGDHCGLCRKDSPDADAWRLAQLGSPVIPPCPHGLPAGWRRKPKGPPQKVTRAHARPKNPHPFAAPPTAIVEVSNDPRCEGCGACCKGVVAPPFTPDERTAMTPEVSALASPQEGRRLDQGCSWLVDGKCGHYDLRPVACRTFQVAGRRCEDYRARAGLVALTISAAKPRRVALEIVEARVAMPCDQRAENGVCLAGCATCRGKPKCRQIAEWKKCPDGKW